MHLGRYKFDEAFPSTDKVQGYTQDFYKYPARFSPKFVRFILDSLTEPGDHVLDPFMGGGTTIVEAAASGRFAIGSDVNRLAKFVTKVKTTPLSGQDISEIRNWVQDVHAAVADEKLDANVTEAPIHNMPLSTYPFFKAATKLVENLRFPRRRQFARWVLLRVGQLTLDARTSIPDVDYLMGKLEQRVEHMLGGMSDFISAVKETGVHKNQVTATRRSVVVSGFQWTTCRTRCGDGIYVRGWSSRHRRSIPGCPRFVPPWQVLVVRRETPAPYWIADVQDGQKESYYTMGGRSTAGLDNYFAGLSAAFMNIRQIIAQDAKVVQLVAFSNAASQLPRYLEAMAAAGFEEASAGGIDSPTGQIGSKQEMVQPSEDRERR